MPGLFHTKEEAEREIAEVENALFDGGLPAATHSHGSHAKTAVRIAADRLGIADATVRRHVGSVQTPGSFFRNHGLTVNWSMYRPPAVAPIDPGAEPPPSLPPDTPSDPVELRRLKDQVASLTKRAADAERRAGEAEDIRAGVLGLTAEPLRAQIQVPGPDNGAGGRTVVLHLSDVHYGENVNLEEMDGLNRYDADVAKARLGRFFGKAADLMTKYWRGDPPDEIILCLGGDLISGNIHPELEQTNDFAVPKTVRDIGELVAGGIEHLARKVKCPIRVYSVPGNHGRMTMKPQSKGRAAGSLDLLATDFCEATVRGARVNGVTFHRTSSPDAYFSTYGWHWCLTHGDTMGGRGGGTGFIGPMAAIIKGHRKLVDTSWRSGRPVHYCLTAHYHTTGKSVFGWANGSVVSYGEYARDLRADPEPAKQNFLVVHPRYGVVEERALYLGDQSEGSLYAGPASVVRPAWGEQQ